MLPPEMHQAPATRAILPRSAHSKSLFRLWPWLFDLCGCPVRASACAILSQMDALADKPQKKFYLETFGCQMNVHDSEKVIGTLVHEGYAQVETVEEADLVLYNTCSIRDKAEQKVFNRLNDYKTYQKQGKKFG